jgi:hypothetical protein
MFQFVVHVHIYNFIVHEFQFLTFGRETLRGYDRMILVLISLGLLGLFLWCYFHSSSSQDSDHLSHFKARDISCSQVCDVNNPGAMTVCSTGKGEASREACRIYDTCVTKCRARQAKELQEKPLKRFPMDPEESWGSRYSHLFSD